jgi:hypothetical protein
MQCFAQFIFHLLGLELLSAILSDMDILNVPWAAVTAHGTYIYIFFNWNGLTTTNSTATTTFQW